MEFYYCKSICIIVILLCCNLTGISQVTSDSVLKFGGIKFESDEQQTLDNALMGVTYQFTQEAYIQDKTIIVTDTLLLAIGNSHSIFLDPYYKEELEKSRRTRMMRSRKIGRANMEHENMADIAHLIGINSEYVEENNGDPLQIYKNRNKGIVSSVYNSFVDNLICEQQIEAFSQWILTDQTDTIFNYPCKKAMTTYAGRNYTAWFTLEIPVNDGPWKFHGLPGLIIHVEDDKQLFQYTVIGLQQYQDNAQIVKDNEKYEKASLKEFNNYVKKEKSRSVVSFHNEGQLYMTYKQNPITYIDLEVEK